MTQTSMATNESLPLGQPNARFQQLRDYSAWVLFVIHLIQPLLNFALFEWIKTDQNRWIIQFTETLPPWIDYTFIVLDMISFIAALFFFMFGFLTLFSYEVHPQPHLSLKDLVYYLAWNQIIYLLFYYLLNAFSNASDINMLLQFITDISYLITAIALFWGRFSVLGFRIRIPYPRLWILLPLFTFSAYLFIYFIADEIAVDWVSQVFSLEMTSERMESIEQDIESSFNSGWGYLLLQWVLIGLIGPINEEILYRGFYQQLFTRRWGTFVGILIPSLIFALDHIDPPLFLSLFISGVVLAIFRHLYKSLWASILLHILINTAALTFDFIDRM